MIQMTHSAFVKLLPAVRLAGSLLVLPTDRIDHNIQQRQSAYDGIKRGGEHETGGIPCTRGTILRRGGGGGRGEGDGPSMGAALRKSLLLLLSLLFLILSLRLQQKTAARRFRRPVNRMLGLLDTCRPCGGERERERERSEEDPTLSLLQHGLAEPRHCINVPVHVSQVPRDEYVNGSGDASRGREGWMRLLDSEVGSGLPLLHTCLRSALRSTGWAWTGSRCWAIFGAVPLSRPRSSAPRPSRQLGRSPPPCASARSPACAAMMFAPCRRPRTPQI